MSFASLRPYFIDRMRAVDPDLREWFDAFNIENIPSSILDKSWHLAFQPMTYSGTAHLCLEFNSPVRLSVCLKGYREPQEAVDRAHLFADAIIKECCKPINRLTQPHIKNVLPNLVDVRALTQDNDNVCVLELSFDCIVIIEAKN